MHVFISKGVEGTHIQTNFFTQYLNSLSESILLISTFNIRTQFLQSIIELNFHAQSIVKQTCTFPIQANFPLTI